ncbi:uncharacterized protein LOC119669848 [Teleopsis dalmanni]|uniref:uncharacterized protein LOC119669848 n=1 Tax=Teleopsis dalmanni TaxID=139649 RepID=UPI0018CF87D6|nr:uncharacterized protein LOC119669848 [Teleopsis dalmanni]
MQKTKNIEYAFMQVNGRKVLGPPINWQGPAPSSSYEIYIRNIPKTMNPSFFAANFLRFGNVYEIRLPLEQNQQYRGYGYVKYTNEEDALRAVEVLNHFYIEPGVKLDISFSFEKNQLYISNIPNFLKEDAIKTKLQQILPTAQRVTLFNRNQAADLDSNDKENLVMLQSLDYYKSEGRTNISAIAHFASHADAVEAKRMANPGTVRLWNSHVRIVWAKSSEEHSFASKSLYLRNFDSSLTKRDLMNLILAVVPRTSLRKLTMLSTTAFIDFTNREYAVECLQKLQGIKCGDKSLRIEFAKNNYINDVITIDFDAILRLKCIANDWEIPIIIFGTYYEEHSLQYCAIILRKNVDDITEVRTIYCIMHTDQLVDIHSRLCETVSTLIECIGTFPDVNYIVDVQHNTAYILGYVQQMNKHIKIFAAQNTAKDKHFEFDMNELTDLFWAVPILSYMHENILIKTYYQTFDGTAKKYLPYANVFGYRIFGTIMPKYRNANPLGYGLNETQLIFALCHRTTATNYDPEKPYTPTPQANFQSSDIFFKSVSFQLLPIDLRENVTGFKLKYLLFGDTNYYHPEIKSLTDFGELNGFSYKQSIRTLSEQRSVSEKKYELPKLIIKASNCRK